MYSVKNVQNILKEIKFRITWVCLSFLATSVCSYFFSEELLFLLAKPFLLSFFQSETKAFLTWSYKPKGSPEAEAGLVFQGLSEAEVEELPDLASQTSRVCKTVTTLSGDRVETLQYHLQSSFSFEEEPEGPSVGNLQSTATGKQTVAFFLSTQLTETLNTYLTTSLVLSSFFCIPHLLYQAWCFFIPSCYVYERHRFTQIFFISIVFCFATFYFCITCLLPNVWHFLYEINRTTTSVFVIQLQPKIYDFIMLTIHVLVSMFICSQTLVILITLIKYKKIHARDLIQHRKFVVFFSVLVTALITPPDLLSQFSALLPFLMIIESIIFYSILHHLYNKCTN